VSANPEYGGMGLPQALNMAVMEMIASGCLALQLNPLLTQGQIEALEHHGSDEMKALYLPKLISGEWSGTMNLTEPQARFRCRRADHQGRTRGRRHLSRHRAKDLSSPGATAT
jgi:alkylation response protein AidB-like acyl-CoA dehydrogenase